MSWQDKVIKTDPTQIIVACIIGCITDVDHLTFLLPLSEKVPVHANSPSGFVAVLLLQQLRPHKNAFSSVRFFLLMTRKMCFMLCFCAITGWWCLPCSLCILRGDILEEKGWNTAICLLCVVYCKRVSLQVIAGLSGQWFVFIARYWWL